MTPPAPRTMAWVGVLFLLLTSLGTYGAAAAAPSAAAPAPATAPVVLVGTGGFTWSDVSAERTPALWALLERGASSTVSVRSVDTNTCPVDGWLSLSAGNRAAAPAPSGSATREVPVGCPPIPTPAAGQVPGWAAYVRAAESLRFGATLGTLGDSLAAGGIPARAIGPGAALGLATADGRIANYTDAVAAAGLGASGVTVIDVGSVRDPDDLGSGEIAPGATVTEQLVAIDKRVAAIVAATPPTTDLIVAGLADAGMTSRLRPIVATGPNFASGSLQSPSTRQAHLVQSSDLTVTLLHLAGVPVPKDQGGGFLVSRPEGGSVADRHQALVDIDLATFEGHALVPPFFNGLIIAQLVIYLVVWGVWRGRVGSVGTRRNLLTWVRRVAVFAASVPVASFLANLIPWWRAEHPMPAVIGSVALFAAIIAIGALLPPWGRSPLGPLAVVGAVTAGVLAVDVMTGSHLQISSMMGLQPVVGGRFYGMGNVTFSLFATGLLMLAIPAADRLVRAGQRTAAALAVGGLGLAGIVIDGSPSWGADGGGPPALFPAIVYLVFAVVGLRMTRKRALIVGVVTVAAFLLVGFADSLRPPDKQTHLGRFFDSLGSGDALDTVLRKAENNISVLISSTLTILVPVALVFVVFVLLRPTSWGLRALERSFERAPLLRSGLIAWLIVMIIGFFINDSGVAIPSVGATVAIPLVIAVATRTLLTQPDPA